MKIKTVLISWVRGATLVNTMKRALCLIALALCIGCSKDHPQLPGLSVTGTPAAQTKTFLLMGQSNMTGWGMLSGSVDPRIILVGAAAGIGNFGNGPGVPFAGSLLTYYPSVQVRLIQCAVGGTPMDYWIPSGNLYQACLAQAHGYTIDGVLFSQGEADAQLNATGWAMKFLSMVRGLRADLHNDKLPVVFTQLGTNAATLAGWDEVKQEQASAAGPSLSMIQTEDLDKVDQYHYTLASYATLGQRMARAMYGLLSN